MTFSYTLLLVLILLFPGLCAWAGLRAAGRTDLLTPRPDKPNSTATLFVIVLGTITGHLIGSLAFVIEGLWCRLTGWCAAVSFDPNVYRVLFTAKPPGTVTDLAVFAWLFELALVGLAAGAGIVWLGGASWIRDRWDAIDFGWLNTPVRTVRNNDQAVILAYVVTKTAHDGASVAYEGIVQQLAMDDDQVITMLLLGQVDRFLVRITDAGLMRIDENHQPIAQMQFHLSEIANIALELIERPSAVEPPAPDTTDEI